MTIRGSGSPWGGRGFGCGLGHVDGARSGKAYGHGREYKYAGFAGRLHNDRHNVGWSRNDGGGEGRDTAARYGDRARALARGARAASTLAQRARPQAF